MQIAASTHYAPAGMLGAIKAVLDCLGRFPMPLLELAFRFGVGSVFFKSGLVKLESWQQTIQLFRDEYQVPLLPPEVAAYMATTAELTAPVMIMAGLGARLGAAALLGMTFVIQVFVYPESWAEHLTWAGLLGYVLTRGPGAISLDRFFAARWLRD